MPTYCKSTFDRYTCEKGRAHLGAHSAQDGKVRWTFETESNGRHDNSALSAPQGG